jgi:hypothetical protein
MTQVVKPYKVTNNEATTLASYSVTIPNEDGYLYVSHTAEVGTYDPNTGIWTITDFPSGTSYTLNITWGVQINETCTGNCLDEAIASPVNINHGNTLTISGKIPCSALCDNGTTVLTLGDFSDNVEVDLEVSSGDYLVTLLDPTYDWYFEYTIECIYCNQKTGPFGPGKVEGAPSILPKKEFSQVFNSFTGVETSVTITVENLPTDGDQIDVYYVGAGILIPTIDYTVAGNTINFVSFTPIPSETVFVKFRKSTNE